MAKVIMIQGTMSNVGKSVIAAGLCRVFVRDGYRVAPFKSQNMALNSYITDEGLEMGRAQVMQAECAMTRPRVCMNPILLKPVDDCGSQVIVNGTVVGNMRALEYFEYKKTLRPVIMEAFGELSKDNDIIVVEGAGSPAEINLKDGDIVNMGLAEMLDASVLLVGDIDRGGVFAQLLGTLDLLTQSERSRVKGLIINKFRGDVALLEPGLLELYERGGCPIAGVVPYADIKLDDEDSLSERLGVKDAAGLDIAVIRLPHISNFTDLNVFEQAENVSVRYVESAADLKDPDMLIIPGTKNTVGDMRWLRSIGLADVILDYAETSGVIVGICGGYQMLGRRIDDPDGAECAGSVEGLGLLPIDTVFGGDKIRRTFKGTLSSPTGVLSALSGCKLAGYEIHMGISEPFDTVSEFTSGKSGYCKGNVYGSYLHGLFDKADISAGVLEAVAKHRNKAIDTAGMTDHDLYKDKQYDRLADLIRQSLDMDMIYGLINE